MSSLPTFEPRKRPRQARSQLTVTALLDATHKVLVTRGYEACTTNLVAEVAGVAIGSLYEYFPNRDALVAGLVEREADGFFAALAVVIGKTADKPLEEALPQSLAATLDELDARRPLLRVLMRECPHLHRLPAITALPRRAAELGGLYVRRLGREATVDDGEATYHVLQTMVGSACLTHIMQPTTPISRERVIAAMSEILLRVLSPDETTAVRRRSSIARC